MNKYASYILYMLISILVALLFVNGFAPLDGLQRSLNDFFCRFTAGDGARPNVAFVSIDSRAQEEYGQWPWNHDLIADLLAATATGEPKAIIVDFVISEDARQDSADFTDILAGQLTWIDNVVMPYDVALATFRSNKTYTPKHLFDFSVAVDNPLGLMDEDASLQVRKVFLPAEKILESDPYLGYDYTMPDEDKVLRHQSMVMNYAGYYYPSLALLGAAVYLDVSPADIKVIEKNEIQVGTKRRIPINDKSEYLISFSTEGSFQKFSAADVLAEGFDLNRLKNKVVIVDFEDFSSTQQFRTPVHGQAKKSLITASVAENIVNDNILTPKTDMTLIGLLLIFALGGICAFVLPQLSLLYRLIVLGAALVIMANINYFLFSSFKVIVDMVYYGTELILFMLASPVLDSEFVKGITVDKKKKARSGVPTVKFDSETDKDDRPSAVREIISSPTDPENQKTTAIDGDEPEFPADHQAINIDGDPEETIIAGDSGEVEHEPEEAALSQIDSGPVDTKDTGDTEIPGTGPEIISAGDSQGHSTAESAGITRAGESGSITGGLGGAMDIKSLGRYQITGTLGKGAMGHVYKGIDPAINRPVALKTIRLDFVNDPDEMAELKERLFREAQAAGKLSHPNIVTIYDVGSEGHLQYIAMEYLEGQTLDEMIKKKTKFNYKIIAKIIIQICSALEYAHEEGIVHRDIKPANIMVLKDYRIKVMDYGIARIDSNSMTKTGIAMGTPNYISPEQLRGLPVDSRADIFSLGVVFYEMLVGRRPFRGENITSLIYSTLNHEPEKPSNVNPQIPLLFDHIIDKALRKVPQERYQKASEMTADLNEFVASFVS
ncbi:MAG: protein kinase [Candidatus Zixiibacteriota bacterium]|nr:MAG: protein kinase [candidate division Zixibacteria bacterium]